MLLRHLQQQYESADNVLRLQPVALNATIKEFKSEMQRFAETFYSSVCTKLLLKLKILVNQVSQAGLGTHGIERNLLQETKEHLFSAKLIVTGFTVS